MGKAKKQRPSKGSAPAKMPLDQQIEESGSVKAKNRNKIRLRCEEDEEFVGAELSKKILTAARKQQQELEQDFGHTKGETSRKIAQLDDDDAEDGEEDEEEDITDTSALGCPDVQLDEDDEKALELFMNQNPAPRRTLADLIMGKITEKQTELETQCSDAGSMVHLQDLDPRVKQMYEGVRDVLRKYRSGKLPKALKIVPRLKNWEQILFITDPPTWSAAAMYQATRIFASNLKDKMAQRFYNLVLLPRIRDDLAEFKRLNYHLYQALRKSLFKPGGFMKGFLLPLLESGTCTLREAIIVGSVIERNSVPVLHSSAAMLKIAEMDYTGANSIFLRIFIDKKYALPYRVVDALVFHFLRFERDPRVLPVLWHQALLAFSQRYKGDISTEQREALLNLLKKQNHPKITPEIRRELQNAKCRDLEYQEGTAESDEPMKMN